MSLLTIVALLSLTVSLVAQDVVLDHTNGTSADWWLEDRNAAKDKLGQIGSWNMVPPPSMQHIRRLQTVPIPPTRQCGQALGTTPREVISLVMGFLGQALGNVTLDQTVNYDVQTMKLCGSCESVASTELLADTDVTGFGSYCAEGSYGYDATHSGLLLLPIDRDTGEIIANKKLKGCLFAHSITTDTSKAPSEVFPENLADFLQNDPDPSLALRALYNVMGGLIAASTGVVSVVPDYVGFGQSSNFAKSLSAKLYRQSSVPLWLEAQTMIANITEGCTQLDNIATVGGYSEGGYASFAIALALDRIGVSILSCNSGAGAWDAQEWLQWHLNDFDQGNVNPGVAAIMAYLGVALSSTDPDLANSNVGQDLLLDEWMDPDNFSMWAEGWISSDLSIEEIVPLLPLPNYVQILNPNITNMIRVSYRCSWCLLPSYLSSR